MDGDWMLILTVIAGLSLAGVTGLTAMIGLRLQDERQRLAARLAAGETAAAGTPSPGGCQAEIEAAEQRLAQLGEELAWIEQARAEAQAWQERGEQIRADITALEAGRNAAEQDLYARRADVESLEAQKRTLTAENAEDSARYEQHRQTLSQIDEEATRTRQLLDELLTSTQEIQQRREALTEDEADLQRTLKAYRAEIATLQREIQARRSELQSVDQQAGQAVEQELQARRGEVAELERHIQALADEAATLRAGNERDRERDRQALLRLAQEIAASEQRRQALAEENAGLQRDLETRRSQLNTGLNEVQQRHTALLMEIAALEQERELLSERVAVLRGASEMLKPRPEPPLAATRPLASPPASAPRPSVKRGPEPLRATKPRPATQPVAEPAAVTMVRNTVKTIDTALTAYLFGKPAPKARPAPAKKPAPPAKGS
ncbi:Chromosome partition protein Smc [Azospirillaceae bacterium]|nr:chromosome partition protein Smc [uncultured bacterium]